jgi:hypothetical protein
MTLKLSDHERGAKYKGDYEADLCALQERLAQILVAHVVHGRNSIIVCEGWDAAGKGGAIQRLTARWDPRAFRVWPIAAPTAEEKARHFLWRFWKRLPGAGQIAVFDRSWYGRVLVERVEGFASEAEWRHGYDEINAFEAQQVENGTAIVKAVLSRHAGGAGRAPARPPRPSLEALESERGRFPQPRPPPRLPCRDRGDVRTHLDTARALARDRRQQQEVRPDCHAHRRRRCARRRRSRGSAIGFARDRGARPRRFRER